MNLGPYYAQLDPRWSSKLLGFNTASDGSIGNYGCLITATANMLTLNGDSTTPEVVNNQLKVNNGYVAGTGILYWSAIPKLNPAIIDCGQVSTLAEVNNWLKDGPNYAILQVKNSAGGTHYVLGNLVNTIIDSLDGFQKNIVTYPFVTAHLYKWVAPGKGSITTTIINEDDMALTAAEEIEAYQDLFNRNPGPGDPVPPSGRRALDIIRGASAELQRERDQAAAQLAASVAQTVAAQAAAAVLQAKLDALSTAPAPTTTNMQLVETGRLATRVAKASGLMHDYAGNKPDLHFTAGTIFHQYSTFTVDGSVKVRTQKSKDAGLWYGTDDTLFDPLPAIELSAADTVHLNLSKMYGTIGSLLRKLWPFGK